MTRSLPSPPPLCSRHVRAVTVRSQSRVAAVVVHSRSMVALGFCALAVIAGCSSGSSQGVGNDGGGGSSGSGNDAASASEAAAFCVQYYAALADKLGPCWGLTVADA